MKFATLFAAALAASVYAHNEGFRMTFTSEMDGDEAVPKVATEGRGVLGITLNGHGDSVSFYGAATRLSGPITAVGLYLGEPGAAGALWVDMPKSIDGNTFSGNLPVSTAELRKLMLGQYYVCVATAVHPDCEIRGQIEMARNRQYVAELEGDNAVPKAATGGSGLGVFYLSPDDSVLTVRAVFGGLSDSVTSVHFGYGKAGDADVADLDLTDKVIGGGILAATVKLPAEAHYPRALGKGAKAAHVEWAENIGNGNVFFTVATKAHPAGEIRGQVEESSERIFLAEMAGARNVPASASAAVGLSLFRLSDDDSALSVYAAYGGLDSIASVHLHRGSKTANSDTLPTEPQANWASSLSGSYLRADRKVSAFASPAAILKDIARGNIYTNVHTKAYPAGAIRGQLLAPFRIGTAALLEGAQETPAVSTKAKGVALVTMDPDSSNVTYAIVADSLGSAFASAHFHKQIAGAAGGAVLDLTPAFETADDSANGLIASGIWGSTRATQPFTKELARALAAESLYVNIHSRDNGSGEIRGQIKDRVSEVRAVPVARARPAARASRLRFGADARTLMLEGDPGSSLDLRISDLRGRAALRSRIAIGADGRGREIGLEALRTGVYVAAWSDGGRRQAARFVRK